MKLLNRTPLTSLLRRAALFAALATVLSACGNGGGGEQPCDDCGAESGQIRVTNRAARACEALVEAADGRVVTVEFGEAVAGKVVSEGDRAGISFISTGAAALPEAAGTIRFDGELTLLESTCFDADGQALDGAGVAL